MTETSDSSGQQAHHPFKAKGDQLGNIEGKKGEIKDTSTSFLGQDHGHYHALNQKPAGVQLSYIDPRKRVVALIIDFIACYLAGVVVVMLPFVSRFVSLRAAVLMLFLAKDYPFQGRGLGKNLMGLQVVDARTGTPLTLLQSVTRNMVLVAPIVVLEIMSFALSFIPIDWLFEGIVKILNIIGMLYVAIVLPIECYRAYSRKDSLRKGDEIAHTAVIEASMDFSHIFPR